MNDMAKKKKLMYIAIGVVLVLFVIVGFVLIAQNASSNRKKQAHYVHDKESGYDFFVDPGQAKEVQNDYDTTTLMNTEQLYNFITDNELLQVRQQITEFVKLNKINTPRVRISDGGKVTVAANQDLLFDLTFDNTTLVVHARMAPSTGPTINLALTP